MCHDVFFTVYTGLSCLAVLAPLQPWTAGCFLLLDWMRRLAAGRFVQRLHVWHLAARTHDLGSGYSDLMT